MDGFISLCLQCEGAFQRREVGTLCGVLDSFSKTLESRDSRDEMIFTALLELSKPTPEDEAFVAAIKPMECTDALLEQWMMPDINYAAASVAHRAKLQRRLREYGPGGTKTPPQTWACIMMSYPSLLAKVFSARVACLLMRRLNYHTGLYVTGGGQGTLLLDASRPPKSLGIWRQLAALAEGALFELTNLTEKPHLVDVCAPLLREGYAVCLTDPYNGFSPFKGMAGVFSKYSFCVPQSYVYPMWMAVPGQPPGVQLDYSTFAMHERESVDFLLWQSLNETHKADIKEYAEGAPLTYAAWLTIILGQYSRELSDLAVALYAMVYIFCGGYLRGRDDKTFEDQVSTASERGIVMDEFEHHGPFLRPKVAARNTPEVRLFSEWVDFCHRGWLAYPLGGPDAFAATALRTAPPRSSGIPKNQLRAFSVNIDGEVTWTTSTAKTVQLFLLASEGVNAVIPSRKALDGLSTSMEFYLATGRDDRGRKPRMVNMMPLGMYLTELIWSLPIERLMAEDDRFSIMKSSNQPAADHSQALVATQMCGVCSIGMDVSGMDVSSRMNALLRKEAVPWAAFTSDDQSLHAMTYGPAEGFLWTESERTMSIPALPAAMLKYSEIAKNQIYRVVKPFSAPGEKPYVQAAVLGIPSGARDTSISHGVQQSVIWKDAEALGYRYKSLQIMGDDVIAHYPLTGISARERADQILKMEAEIKGVYARYGLGINVLKGGRCVYSSEYLKKLQIFGSHVTQPRVMLVVSEHMDVHLTIQEFAGQLRARVNERATRGSSHVVDARVSIALLATRLNVRSGQSTARIPAAIIFMPRAQGGLGFAPFAQASAATDSVFEAVASDYWKQWDTFLGKTLANVTAPRRPKLTDISPELGAAAKHMTSLLYSGKGMDRVSREQVALQDLRLRGVMPPSDAAYSQTMYAVVNQRVSFNADIDRQKAAFFAAVKSSTVIFPVKESSTRAPLVDVAFSDGGLVPMLSDYAGEPRIPHMWRDRMVADPVWGCVPSVQAIFRTLGQGADAGITLRLVKNIIKLGLNPIIAAEDIPAFLVRQTKHLASRNEKVNAMANILVYMGGDHATSTRVAMEVSQLSQAQAELITTASVGTNDSVMSFLSITEVTQLLCDNQALIPPNAHSRITSLCAVYCIQRMLAFPTERPQKIILHKGPNYDKWYRKENRI